MTDDEYFRVAAVSNSAIGTFLKSPMLYKKYCIDRTERQEATAAQEFGTAFHCRLLEPKKFYASYVKGPQVARNTTKWKEFIAINGDKIPLKEDEFEKIERMAAAVNNHPEAGRLLMSCETELPVFFKDPVTGLQCKAKIDAFSKSGGYILDIKTSADVYPRAFSQSIGTYGYYRQAAFYHWALSQHLQLDFKSFYFIAVSKDYPITVRVYELHRSDIDAGYREFHGALEAIKLCHDNNSWSAQDDSIEMISRPSWLVNNDPIMEKELT